jgi:hypothetical protein
MTDLTYKLAGERAKEQAATPGPWDNDSGTGRLRKPQGLIAGANWDTEQAAADARLIVSARNAYAALLDVAKAAAVRNYNETFHFEVTLHESDTPTCGECDEDWPCSATNLRAALARLDEALA